MMRLMRSNQKWWRKPLALVDDKCLPAELVVLRNSLGQGEDGTWLNSRGTETVVVDLEQASDGKFHTFRIQLPDFVSKCLKSFYDHPEFAKGVFDLVIWNTIDKKDRFVEVKCPHWDRPRPEQERFAELARKRGIETHISEWEFGSEEDTS